MQQGNLLFDLAGQSTGQTTYDVFTTGEIPPRAGAGPEDPYKPGGMEKQITSNLNRVNDAIRKMDDAAGFKGYTRTDAAKEDYAQLLREREYWEGQRQGSKKFLQPPQRPQAP